MLNLNSNQPINEPVIGGYGLCGIWNGYWEAASRTCWWLDNGLRVDVWVGAYNNMC